MIEVVLRFHDENGIVDATGLKLLETETRSLIFKRAPDGGIGELKHRLAFVTWVVPLGEGSYRLEDLWHGHPARMSGDEDKQESPGGLAFRDVFRAERLTDGSLLFDRVLRKGEWRIDCWILPSPSFLRSHYFDGVVAQVEAHGGCAEPDPWMKNWLWTFLPPEADYDPARDIDEALQMIPRAEIEEAQKELQEILRRSEEKPK